MHEFLSSSHSSQDSPLIKYVHISLFPFMKSHSPFAKILHTLAPPFFMKRYTQLLDAYEYLCAYVHSTLSLGWCAGEGVVTCYDGSTLCASYRCDGREDCPEGEDEANCGSLVETVQRPGTA